MHLLHFGYWWLNLSFLLLLKFQGPEEDALATLKTVSPAVHKYGTENTYVCTWDTWGPFAANLEGGARWDPPMGLLYTSWVGMVGVSDPPTLSEGQKSGWKCPDHEVSLATAKYYV